jgi:DNA-binding MarR family transcriptional regulator
MTEDDKQQELWKTDRKFVRILYSSIDEGHIKAMGASAFTVLAIIRRFTPIAGVFAFPSLGKIHEVSGLSKPTIRKALKTLVKYKYIEELEDNKKTRTNIYKVKEPYVAKRRVDDGEEPETTILNADYNLSKQKEIDKMIRHFDKHGELPTNQTLIQIQKINIQQYFLSDGSMIVQQEFSTPTQDDIERQILKEAKSEEEGRKFIEMYRKHKESVVDEAVSQAPKPDSSGGAGNPMVKSSDSSD